MVRTSQSRWAASDRRQTDARGILFRDAGENPRLQDLRVEPILGSHRNPVREEPFLLTRERFGGAEDVPMVPLLRDVVDQMLRAYAYSVSDLLEHAGKTPISPHGSMALSVTRWGRVDWDYVRDIDFRIFLPPQLGHLSGFKTDLAKKLTSALRRRGLDAVPLGKDERGQAQVQLRDVESGAVHGFHLFLIAMKPDFVRANLHHDGGYSPHYAYFPEGSIDETLEAAGMKWADVVRRQVEDYLDMFNQLSFNIFGENRGRGARLKTPGWYLRKAFKWYATLARMRGLLDLEEDLLYQYDHFQRSEEEFSYLARNRYYARMAPSQFRMEDIQRDLARVDSLLYASARSPKDPWVGKKIQADGREVTILEAVPKEFMSTARRRTGRTRRDACATGVEEDAPPRRARFADGLGGPCVAQFGDGEPAALIPSEWSLVFTDAYARQVMRIAKAEGRDFARDQVQQALGAVLAELVRQAGCV